MKILADKRFSVKFGLIAFLAGSASFFMPHFSGWSEVVFPQFAWIGVFIYLLWLVPFILALGLSSLNTLALFFTTTPSKSKLVSSCFSIVLIALFLTTLPDFAAGDHPGINQRVSFFPVGGQTRILWAGGLETVKRDALGLLEQQSNYGGLVSPDLWPSSLKRLGAVEVQIDSKTQSVMVHIPRAYIFDPDQFGYLFTNEKQEIPVILNDESENRLWKLADRVYFFETW